MNRPARILLSLALLLASCGIAHAEKVTDYPNGGYLQPGDITYDVRGGTNGQSYYGIVPMGSASVLGLLSCGSGMLCTNGVITIAPLSEAAHKFLNGVDSNGNLTAAQLSFGDLSGIISASQYLSATTSTIGAVKPDNITTFVVNGVMSAPTSSGITNLTGDVIATGPGSAVATLSPSGVTPNTYTNPTITLDASGRVTSAANGSGGSVTIPVPVAQGGTGSAQGYAQGLASVPVVNVSALHDMGDSITAGIAATTTGAANGVGYVDDLGRDFGVVPVNRAIGGYSSCDISDQQIMPVENPGATKSPLYTYMAGTNDWFKHGSGAYEAIFNLCDQAGLAWLAVPSQYKVGLQTFTTTGTWTVDNTNFFTGYALASTTSGSTANGSITTYGGPIYLWYRIADGVGGTFTYSIDSGSPVSINDSPSPPISTYFGTTGDAMARVPVSAGVHTVAIVKTNAASVDIAGVGTPAPYPYWNTPTVIGMGVPRAQGEGDTGTASAAYNLDALANVNLLRGDGLRIIWDPVRSYLNSGSDMANQLHPNNTGHQHLADSVEAAAQFVPVPVMARTPNDNDVCNAGALYSDASFIYSCTASGTIKRATLSSF